MSLLSLLKTFFNGRTPPPGPLPSERIYARDLRREEVRDRRRADRDAAKKEAKEEKKALKAAAKAKAKAQATPPSPPKVEPPAGTTKPPTTSSLKVPKAGAKEKVPPKKEQEPKKEPIYQLTPLSLVIQQSSNDLLALRAKNHGSGTISLPSSSTIPSNPSQTVDFDLLERRLESFAGVYDEWREKENGEVHIVTKTAKASELTSEKGGVGVAGSVPLMKVADCSM